MKTLLFLLPLSLQAQYNCTWDFDAIVCPIMIQSCADDVIQDCAYASSNGPVLIGANLDANGVLICSRVHDTGEGFCLVKGWSQGYMSQHFLTVAAIVTSPVHIDTISIQYRTTDGGPSRIRVDWEPSTLVSVPNVNLSDEYIPDTSLRELVFTNVGDVDISDTLTYGGLFVMMRFYDMQSSSTIFLEGVRICASPRIATGVTAIDDDGSSIRYRFDYDGIGRLISRR